jgi:putative DNA methylase
MIPKECKRLAEVDFPIALVSKYSATEKSGPKGYPNMLHLWWARRPLAACRAMLFALLWPDPCDQNCPEEFKEKARETLAAMPGKLGTTDEDLRKALLRFIGDFADWNRSADKKYLEVGRELVKAAHGDEPPLVIDPFAGGGSIPLEALRIGCDAFASDLNPVACLILKVMLEDIPRHGSVLAEELTRIGTDIKAATEKELAEFYPIDPEGDRPIAYLWARTVVCEAPNCGAEIPIYRSPWLSKKGIPKARYFKETLDGRCRALIVTSNPRGGPVEFRIAQGEGRENTAPGFVELTGTKAKGNNANVICPCCGAVLSGSKKNPRVQAQLTAQSGGADVVFGEEIRRIEGARILAVVTIKAGEQGRRYRVANQRDYQAVWKAQREFEKLAQQKWPNELSMIPTEPLPPIGTLGFRVQRYGMRKWADLFTARQKVALALLLSKTRSYWKSGDPTTRLLATAFSRVAMSGMSCTRWNAVAEKMQHTFGRQALPIVWDFAEVVPIANAPGNWKSGYELVADIVNKWPPGAEIGQTQLADACNSPLSSDSAGVWFTDPPYYDAVPYADLSDFFFVWLKRGLDKEPFMRDIFDPSNPLTPKVHEIVQDETKRVNERVKDRVWFEDRMAVAFSEGRRVLNAEGIGCVVFAHKTTEGWEALLSGMIRGGWTITGSWPIATEMGSRLRAMDSAALATSVHLVCRPRPEDAPVGDWGDVLRELPKRVGDWMERLQSEGIRGADLVFACIGPALEIFSRYSRVETAAGQEITLAQYLEKVWEVVGRIALEHVLGTAEAQARNGAAGAIEEDARLTALFLWTLQSTNGEGGEESKKVKVKSKKGEIEEDEIEDDTDDEDDGPSKAKGFSLIFDVVRRFAQPLGIHLPEWENRIIETKKGVVRLLSVSERAKQLFGTDGAQSVADQIEQSRGGRVQGMLFPDMEERKAPKVKGGRRQINVSGEQMQTRREATTLDRVHAAMLLQAGGRANALRALIKEEMDRGGEFLRLANALSALYPRTSEEKRLLDAMLLAVPR